MANVDFRFVAGRPSLDLMATVGSRISDAPIERLPDVDAAHRWFAAVGTPLVQAPGPGDLRRLLELREALHVLFSLRAATGPGGDRDAGQAAVALVNDVAAEPTPIPRLVLDDAGLPVAAPTTITVQQALAQLARDGIDVLTGPDAVRLHQCERDTCATFFLDTSRGPHRRWCSSKTCGNQARVSAHRARAAT